MKILLYICNVFQRTKSRTTKNKSTMEVKVTKENFNELINGNLPVVVDFWAEWCGPCRMVSPILSELAEEYDGKIVVGKCNVDEQRELAIKMNISSIPTMYFFRSGQVVDMTVGAMPKSSLKQKFDKNI